MLFAPLNGITLLVKVSVTPNIWHACLTSTIDTNRETNRDKHNFSYYVAVTSLLLLIN